MDEPLQAHTFNEARYYLMVTACGACGHGPWEIDSSEPPGGAAGPIAVKAHCARCGDERTFRFSCEFRSPSSGPESEQINPTRSPSRIVDLAQWLSLFYLLIERAASADGKVDARRGGFRAALCLAEALKFYGDDELPAESAFFSETSLVVFREHPEKFARQKLRDLRAKLPAIGVMARNIARDGRARPKRWWQFWR